MGVCGAAIPRPPRPPRPLSPRTIPITRLPQSRLASAHPPPSPPSPAGPHKPHPRIPASPISPGRPGNLLRLALRLHLRRGCNLGRLSIEHDFTLLEIASCIWCVEQGSAKMCTGVSCGSGICLNRSFDSRLSGMLESTLQLKGRIMHKASSYGRKERWHVGFCWWRVWEGARARRVARAEMEGQGR